MEKTLEQLEQELEKLENREFMLQMIDHWSSEDYKLHDMLRDMIKAKKEEIEKCKSTM